MARMNHPFGSFGGGGRGGFGLDYSAAPAGSQSAVVSFFNMVYAWMSCGLAVTAVVAWFVSTRPDIMGWMFNMPILIVLFIAQMALVITISAAVNRISPGVATGLFLLYAAVNGLLFSSLFRVYSLPSITGAFAATAGTFAATSLFGMVTKRDLSRLGSIMFMALIGLIIASVVNAFWANSTLYWIVTYAGVLIFTVLTAVDTQRLKQVAYATAGDARMAARYAVNGALQLYLDFINLFLFLIRILGDRRN